MRTGREQCFANGTTVVDRRRGGNITVWLDLPEWKAFEAICKARKVSRADLGRQAVKEYLARRLAP